MSRTKATRANGQAAQVVKKVDARTLIPSPENAVLYRERTTKDADFARLVESVKRDGVQAPLLVSRDNYIVSGHQRREAAIVAKKYMVPVIVLTISRAGHTPDEWLAILREHNTGRERTFDELVREKLLDIDPDEAIAHIVDDQIERTQARVACIDISDREMRRYGISESNSGMVDAILEVLRDPGRIPPCQPSSNPLSLAHQNLFPQFQRPDSVQERSRLL